MSPFSDAAVEARFGAYPAKVRRRMLALRELVLRTAASTPGVGEIQETLKWGEPAYLTPDRTGSTVRMDWKPRDPDHCALYFNCRTDLIETFRTLFPGELRFEGNRALLLPIEATIPKDALAVCIAASLTYHLRKRTA